MGRGGEEAQAHACLSNQGREGHEMAFTPSPTARSGEGEVA